MSHLKKYRLKEDLRQRDLAAKLGVDQATISKLESGVKLPSLELAFLIEDYTCSEVTARGWLQEGGS
ncbi:MULTISPECIES: helix-turn-helix transcriptional regulator [Phaeobacter]|uniref:helix-turn-helix transcriptional regulator n=1 Tax=Phaeobacter TaxID=302485 RepID=UPI00058B4B3C|nr:MULTISPECIES: helix-turn-helix transcriptional regulator [Phaeobacter]AUQ89373.1 transcriptional regulator, y4mF family [Phaeobacter inhibens]KII12603.1 hypothetical protein OO25_17125 [Phaeobacter sp. S60]